MNIKEILNPSLGDLEFELNAHLFQWPGELLYGTGAPVLSERERDYSEPSVSDFRYRGPGVDDFPYPDIDKPIPPAPDKDVLQLRRELMPEPASVRQREQLPQGVYRNAMGFEDEIKIFPPAPSRPNTASAFDLMQQSKLDNPLVQRLNIQALADDLPSPDPDPKSRVEGMTWACNSVSQAAMQINLITPLLASTVRVEGAGAIVKVHLSSSLPEERVEAVIDQFKTGDYARMRHAADAKMKRIGQQYARWQDAGRVAVPTPSGGRDRLLTTVNMATAVIGLSKLRSLLSQVHGFSVGASEAMRLMEFRP